MSVVSTKNYAAFTEVSSSVKEFIHAVKGNKLRSVKAILEALTELEDSINNYLETTSKAQALRPAKPIFIKLLKAIGGIRNGIDQKLMNLSGFKREVGASIYQRHYKDLKQFSKSIRVEEEPDSTELLIDTKTSKRLSNTELLKLLKDKALSEPDRLQAEQLLRESKEREEEKQSQLELYAERKAAVLDYKKYQNKLPKKLNGKVFTVVQAPIVPVFPGGPLLTSPSHVRKSGIKFTELGTGHRLTRNIGGVSKQVDAEDSFVVFDDQTLLAFDINFAAAQFDRKGNVVQRESVVDDMKKLLKGQKQDASKGKPIRQRSKDTLKQRKKSAKDKELIENFLIELLDRINSSSSVKYTVVTNHFPISASNPNIRFAWLMPEAQKRAFLRNASEKGTWNFPWNRESIL